MDELDPRIAKIEELKLQILAQNPTACFGFTEKKKIYDRLFFTLELDFNTMIGDTIKERYAFIADKLATLKNWLCDAVETRECFVLGTPEMLSGLIVGNCDFIDDKRIGPGIASCREMGFKPEWVFQTPWSTDLMAGSYSDEVPQEEYLLIAKGWEIGAAILKIKNYII